MKPSTESVSGIPPVGAISRRHWLMGAAALGLAPAWAARDKAQLVAAWQASAEQRIGVIEVGAQLPCGFGVGAIGN